jgi:hypothetical protein
MDGGGGGGGVNSDNWLECCLKEELMMISLSRGTLTIRPQTIVPLFFLTEVTTPTVFMTSEV